MFVSCFVAIAANAWTVYFTNPEGWPDVAVWAWDSNDNNKNYTGGSWPGKLMTKSGDVWTYTGEGNPNKILFNNNDNGKQTNDFSFVDGATYNMDGVVGAPKHTYTIYYDNSITNWKDVYVYTFTPELAGGWPGTKLTQNAEGLYQWDYISTEAPAVEGIIFNNGNGGDGNQTKNLVYEAGGEYNKYGLVSEQIYSHTVYFDNTDGWTDVYAYGWGTMDYTPFWPGTKLSPNENGLYEWTFKSSWENPTIGNEDGFQFNNGEDNGSKTPDIKTFEEGDTYYPNGTSSPTTQPAPKSEWYYNVSGAFNNWGSDNGQQPSDSSILKWENLSLASAADEKQGEFEIKIWNGVSDIYFGNTDGFALGEWIQCYENGGHMYLDTSNPNQLYNVQYNVETDQIFVSKVGPKSLYIVGTLDDGTWQQSEAISYDTQNSKVDEGLYLFNKVGLTDNGGWVAFQFFENKPTTNTWDGTGTRYVPQGNTNSYITLNEAYNFEANTPAAADGSFMYYLPGDYTITFDYNKNTITVENLTNIVYPQNIYVIGNIQSGMEEKANPTIMMEMPEDEEVLGDFTIYNLPIYNYTGDSGYGYIAFCLNNNDAGKEWDDIAPIFGGTNNNKIDLPTNSYAEFQLAPNVSDDNFTLFEVKCGIYNVTFSFSDNKVYFEESTAPLFYLESDMAMNDFNQSFRFIPTSEDTYNYTYSLYLGSVKEGETFKINSCYLEGEENNKSNVEINYLTFGKVGDYINNSEDDATLVKGLYNLQSNSAESENPMQFPADLLNVTLTFNFEDMTLSIEGTAMPTDELVLTIGNDKTLQSGTVIENEINLVIAGKETGAVYIYSPNNEQVYYMISPDENNTKALAGYKAASPNATQGAYEIGLPVGTGTLSLYYGDNDTNIATYSYEVTNDDKNVPTGVDAIEAVEEGEAVFYNLQGVRVNNPENGIFIKVVNGKSSKVLIRK